MALQAIDNAKIYDPSTGVQATLTNYQNEYNFANQFFPDLMSEMVNIFNPQSITGFMDAMSMEEMFAADQTIWSEGGRRHKYHRGVTRSGNVFTSTAHSVRVRNFIMVVDRAGAKVEFGVVTSITDDTFTAALQSGATWTAGTTNLEVRAFGSEFAKGTEGMKRALTREFSIYQTSPIIMKDVYETAGSDIPRITWIYDDAKNPYWYFQDETETFKRFLDNIEAQMLLETEVDPASTLTDVKGTQGLFSAIRSRGATFGGQIASLGEADDIVRHLEKVNGESTNTMFLSTDHILNIDDALAGELGYDAATLNYGVFDNKKDTILELGFKGFRRGTYEFHYQGWQFLKDPTAFNPDNFAAANQVHGIMVPMGTMAQEQYSNAIEGQTPERIQYLTQMIKGKPGYSRKLQTYFHGSQMTPYAGDTSDVYGINWLTERCIRPAGMIKWLIFEGV